MVAAPEVKKQAILTKINSIADFSSTIRFYLNGTEVILDANSVDPASTLLDFLRSQKRLTGTKLGCGEGGCGACSVVIQFRSARTGKIQHNSVNACLAPLASIDGKHVITIEALGTVANPHPLQERLIALHGSQCGFCTPGIVMSIYAMLRNAMYEKGFKLTADEVELDGVLDGNLCRCTGYKPILDAAKSFVADYVNGNLTNGNGANGAHSLSIPPNYEAANVPSGDSRKSDGCCGPKTNGQTNGAPKGCGRTDCCQLGDDKKLPSRPISTFPKFDFKPYTPGTELIYPAALTKHVYKPLAFGSDYRMWLRPSNLNQLLQIKAAYPQAKLVSGSSEVQVEIKFKAANYDVCVYVSDIPELLTTEAPKATDAWFTFGANLPLFELETLCEQLYKELGPQKASALAAIKHQLRYFAGRQIRNVATASGNLVTASPISDLNPVLLSIDAILVAQSLARGEFEIPMAEFFQGYRRTALPPDAVLTKIKVPLNQSKTEQQVVKAYKQAKRRDDDISIVTASMSVTVDQKGVVTSAKLVYGGMAPTTVVAKGASAFLVGKTFTDSATLEGAIRELEEEFKLPFNVPGDMATYRRTLTTSFFFKFWHEVIVDLKLDATLPAEVTDITTSIHRQQSRGTRDNSDPYAKEVVGKQFPHLSGAKHVTGEAIYIDDMPAVHGELYGALVVSERAHAKLVSVDPSAALTMPGVLTWVDHNDIQRPEDNFWGLPGGKEPFFAVDHVMTAGIPIGLILADTKIQAQAAARAVIIRYEDLPAILTIEDAIEKESYFPWSRVAATGKDVEEVFREAPHVFSGTARMGGQEHFYLETNATIVIPKEDGELEVFCSTQALSETQEMIAQNVPSSKILARGKRMGGGFGGKETRSVQLAGCLAVGAQKTKRATRCMLDRDMDMMTTGQRHPFLAHWKVACDKDGKLQALSADVYCNGGHSLDISGGVMERALGHIDNAYYTPNVSVRGRICKTNTMSNTAFRGFGGPQGMFIAEAYIEAIALGLGKSLDEIRSINLYQEGDKTQYRQTITDLHIPRLMKDLASEAQYEERRAAVDKYNKEHKYHKRGLSFIPVKFGVAFGAKQFNQASALVHIYKDGSVLVAHGGTEMGQGLYTKCLQIAAEELGVPLSSCFTSESATNTIANASATAASVGSDLNGAAVQNACQQLAERLEPYWAKFGGRPKATLRDVAHAAYMDRVPLSASGFWKTPTIGYVWQNIGDPPRADDPAPMYFYYTQGAAISEVEIDCLTGDSTVLRTDIKMDVGRSINPAIDYGQIEGAFVQGQGLFTMEESLWFNHNGQLATRGPGAYKIPGFSDIPQVFNVSLLRDAEWPTLGTVNSSKGVGEPPLFLGASCMLAIRDALRSAREDNGVTEALPFVSPMTSERIRNSVGDDLWKRGEVKPREGEKSFFLRI